VQYAFNVYNFIEVNNIEVITSWSIKQSYYIIK
jgi:hypothetical protein